MKYREKSSIIEAVQWTGTQDSYEAIQEFVNNEKTHFWIDEDNLMIATSTIIPNLITTVKVDVLNINYWLTRQINGSKRKFKISFSRDLDEFYEKID